MNNARGRKAIKTASREMTLKADAARVAEAEKTTRLRALRLAKEAADRAAAQHAPPPARIPGAASARLRRADDKS